MHFCCFFEKIKFVSKKLILFLLFLNLNTIKNEFKNNIDDAEFLQLKLVAS